MPVAELEHVEQLAPPSDPLLHSFPGFERCWEPPPPPGAVAYCGYVCRGIQHEWGSCWEARPDSCIVCDELSRANAPA